MRLMDHTLLSRFEFFFVRTHERFDPTNFNPVFDNLQAQAEQLKCRILVSTLLELA